MADVVKPSVRSAMMSGIRGKDTLPEMVLRRGLFARGIRFRLHVRTLPGCPDIVIRKRRAAIFVHGCFWHAHEGCRYFRLPKDNRDFWREKLNKNRLRDVAAVQELMQLGWRVVVVWECATRQDSQKLTNRICSFIESHGKYIELSSRGTALKVARTSSAIVTCR